MRTDVVHGVHGVTDTDDDEIVAAGAHLGRRGLGKSGQIVDRPGIEPDPFRPGTAERVAADHVAGYVHDIAPDEGSGRDDQEADDR